MSREARTLAWLDLHATGLLGLERGMSDAELAEMLGTVREGHLPSEHLRAFEHVPAPDTEVNASVECVLDHGRLSEVRVGLFTYEVGLRQRLLDAVASALDGLGDAHTPKRRWVIEGSNFELRADPEDVLEEGMPAMVTVSVTWKLDEPAEARVKPAQGMETSLDWSFVFVDNGSGVATPAGARLGESFEDYADRLACPNGQRRQGDGYYGVLVTDVEVDDDDRIESARVSLTGKGGGFERAVQEWKRVVQAQLGPERKDGTFTFAWGDDAGVASLDPADLGTEWSLGVAFTKAES